MAEAKDLDIRQGETFTAVVRWETTPIVYRAISAITRAAPVQIGCPGHDLVSGWRVALQSIKGMTELNAENDPPRKSDYHPVTVVDPDTIELNDIDASLFGAYESGGYVRYNTPANLSGQTPRMQIRNKPGGTLLASSEAGDAPLNTITLTVDTNAKTVTMAISATGTAAWTFKKAVYELEMVSGSGVVTTLLVGNVTVTREVATD